MRGMLCYWCEWKFILFLLLDNGMSIRSENRSKNYMRCSFFMFQAEVWICMEMMATCLEKLLTRTKTPIPEKILGKMTVSVSTIITELGCWPFVNTSFSSEKISQLRKEIIVCLIFRNLGNQNIIFFYWICWIHNSVLAFYAKGNIKI